MEDIAHFIAEELLLFQAFDVVTNGVPDRVESLHLILHGHVVLYGGLGEGPLGFHNLIALLFELLKLGDGRFDRSFIPAGIQAEFCSGKELDDGCGHIHVVRGQGYFLSSQNRGGKKEGKEKMFHKSEAGFAAFGPDEFSGCAAGGTCVVPEQKNVKGCGEIVASRGR